MKLRCVMTTAVILISIPGLEGSGPDAHDFEGDAVQAETKRFEGTWRSVSTEIGGRRTDAGEKADERIVISGSEFAIHSGKRVSTFTMTIDPDAKPPRIELTTKSNTGNLHGSYRFEVARLILILDTADKTRPTEFRTASGTSQVLRSLDKSAP